MYNEVMLSRKQQRLEQSGLSEIDCETLLQNITNNFLEYEDMIYQIYRNSGKDYNDLGRYEDCTNMTEEFRYILATIPNVFPIPMSVGICVPSICTVQDFNSFKPFFVGIINLMIPEFFNGIKGFDPQTQVNTEDLFFEDSKSLNASASSMNGGAVFFIILSCTFILGVIASTILNWKRRQTEKFKEELRVRSSSGNNAFDNDQKLREGSENSIKRTTQRRRQKPKTCSERLMIVMSMQENLRILFTRRAPAEDQSLETLNGVRVATLTLVILGNTYFYILKGPLQNLSIIQEWMSNYFFTVILSAELAVDIFFWMTAFLACYFFLNKMHDNNGILGSSFKIIFNRFMRLFPLYFFVLLFYWKFIVLFGGDGPMFFMYDSVNQCNKNWIWHILFLNNLVPWSNKDNCMGWTWYLANDFQFYLLIPLFVTLYYRRRKVFYLVLSSIALFSVIIQMSVITANSLSASYFTYDDEYWTIYYVKPYSRINQFLIGVLSGCFYYTYQRELESPSAIANLFTKMKEKNALASALFLSGIALMWIICSFLQWINNNPDDVSLFANLIFLIFGRPFFIFGFTICIFPIILGCTHMRWMRSLLSHDFWVPFSRLSYGAYLVNEVFMVFRDFNTERGQWACAFDCILFFFAYVLFSFTFSFFLAIFIEMPCMGIWYEFMIKQQKSEDVYLHSQSAKSGLKGKGGQSNMGTAIGKDQLLFDGGKNQKLRRTSVDTEDLEEETKSFNEDHNNNRFHHNQHLNHLQLDDSENKAEGGSLGIN